jgi:hypothetical protein
MSLLRTPREAPAESTKRLEQAADGVRGATTVSRIFATELEARHAAILPGFENRTRALTEILFAISHAHMGIDIAARPARRLRYRNLGHARIVALLNRTPTGCARLLEIGSACTTTIPPIGPIARFANHATTAHGGPRAIPAHLLGVSAGVATIRLSTRQADRAGQHKYGKSNGNNHFNHFSPLDFNTCSAGSSPAVSPLTQCAGTILPTIAEPLPVSQKALDRGAGLAENREDAEIRWVRYEKG